MLHWFLVYAKWFSYAYTYIVSFKYTGIACWDFVLNFAFEKNLSLAFFRLTPFAKESEASLGTGVSPSLFPVTGEGEVKGCLINSGWGCEFQVFLWSPLSPELVPHWRLYLVGCKLWLPTVLAWHHCSREFEAPWYSMARLELLTPHSAFAAMDAGLGA